MELPKQLAYDEFADVVRGDGRVVITLDTRNDEDDIAVVLAAVQRYNAHAALMELYKTAAEMRMLGYQFPLGLTVKLNAIHNMLRGAAGEQTGT
jgi:hypothetical protein